MIEWRTRNKERNKEITVLRRKKKVEGMISIWLRKEKGIQNRKMILIEE